MVGLHACDSVADRVHWEPWRPYCAPGRRPGGLPDPEVRTGRILGELAQGLGCELAGIDLFRTRIATASRQQLREEVVRLRRPG